jgi:hypothetical protein
MSFAYQYALFVSWNTIFFVGLRFPIHRSVHIAKTYIHLFWIYIICVQLMNKTTTMSLIPFRMKLNAAIYGINRLWVTQLLFMILREE